MNLPIPTDSPLWIGIGAACFAMRPVFLALAILMLDRGERGWNRLRVLQSLIGKAPPSGWCCHSFSSFSTLALGRRACSRATPEGDTFEPPPS